MRWAATIGIGCASPFSTKATPPPKKRAISEFLTAHGYKVAQVTISFGDYAYNEPYARCLATNDQQGIDHLKLGYLDGAALSLQQSVADAELLYGRDIKHVMLLHVGSFQTVMLPRLLELLNHREFRLITLPEAASDPAYPMHPDLPSKYGGTFLEMSLAARHITPVHNPPLSLAWLDQVCR